jgi:hypothetical protein
MLVIDAANVIGSRPTGWWSDRPGAARRFTDRVRATAVAGRLDPRVTVVIARSNCDVVVVTADRDLAGRVRAVDGVVVGPTWLLDQLEDWSG